MTRRRSSNSFIEQIATNHARKQREQAHQLQVAQRNETIAQREALRQKAQQEKDANRKKAQQKKEENQRYLDCRMQETEILNTQLSNRINDLNALLIYALRADKDRVLDSEKIVYRFSGFVLPLELREIPERPSLDKFLASVNKPSIFEMMIPRIKKRYEDALQEATTNFHISLQKHEELLISRESAVQKLQQEVENFNNAYCNCNPKAIISYNSVILEQSKYPEGFPQDFRIGYVPESKELVIEYDLPNISIVPNIIEYRYVKTNDSIISKPRKSSEIKDIYENIVSSVCLRTIYEVINYDVGNHILVVVFNGFVQTIDPATGRDIRPCLISVRVTKAKYLEIDLYRINYKSCLKDLGARISPHPDEMISVKPVVEYDMVDKRFINQENILSDLDNRPNIMDLNPFEFETLVSNLFTKIGFVTKQTRTTRDNGVDAVAFDPRPILGGKVVIQAKRYKNVVGVSAVRDLYGTMINEGANKGILVTTSHYGPDAYEFAKDKPIELIDGGGLLYLLEQNGIYAKIIMPVN